MLLHYITDRHAFAGDEARQRQALLQRLAEAAAAGVDYIQLREKDLAARELEQLAREAVATVRANSPSTRVLINGRVDIAVASGADGVHLPGKSLPASEVRAIWMNSTDRGPVISVAAHSVDEVRYAEAHAADFAVLGPVFEKPKTNLRGIGLGPLATACTGATIPDNTEAVQQSSFPVFALGGVTLDNAVACVRAGASGVAGIRLFQEGDMVQTVRALKQMK